MFTGIVEELGTVRAITHHDGGARVEILAGAVLADAEIGASIAVNGCCLTVVERGDDWWAADAVTETLDRTVLGALAPGDAVNLERPVRLADRLGGHIVQGHVDAVGTIVAKEPMGDGSVRVDVGAPPDVMRYVVEKGSITVDGISLTVASLGDNGFAVAVIPHTLAVTTLGTKGPGDPVNLEVDVVAKYVERLMATQPPPWPNEVQAPWPNAQLAES
jgi:riboflavin synthase